MWQPSDDRRGHTNLNRIGFIETPSPFAGANIFGAVLVEKD
jgi:hypothetical protein